MGCTSSKDIQPVNTQMGQSNSTPIQPVAVRQATDTPKNVQQLPTVQEVAKPVENVGKALGLFDEYSTNGQLDLHGFSKALNLSEPLNSVLFTAFMGGKPDKVMDKTTFLNGISLFCQKIKDGKVLDDVTWHKTIFETFADGSADAIQTSSSTTTSSEFADFLSLVDSAPKPQATTSTRTMSKEKWTSIITGLSIVGQSRLTSNQTLTSTSFLIDPLYKTSSFARFDDWNKFTRGIDWIGAIQAILKESIYDTPYLVPPMPTGFVDPKTNTPAQNPLITPELLWLVSMIFPERMLFPIPTKDAHHELQVSWDELYRGSLSGWSTSRFTTCVTKYPAPTLFLLQGTLIAPTSGIKAPGVDYATQFVGQPITILTYVGEEWKNRKDPWCSSNPFTLISSSPRGVEVSKPLTNGPHRCVQFQTTWGIGFGGEVASTLGADKGWRCKIESTLQTGHYQYDEIQSQQTLDSLSGSFYYNFKIEDIAVYGLGGPGAYMNYTKSWNFENSEAARRMEVKVRKAGGDIDRELLKMVGLIDDVEGRGIERYETEQEKQAREYAKEQGRF